MNLYPNYYHKFHCIADKCRHSCCEGWEVEIDEESLEKYEKDGLPHIEKTEDGAHFILGEHERCPYLNERKLCQLIIEKGEEYLCQICTDHPRFRNFWTGVTEIGLGMVCEEAARIILTEKEPMHFVTEEGKLAKIPELPWDEQDLWKTREKLLNEAAETGDPMKARLREYFIFRHLPDAMYDDRLEERIRFIGYCVSEVERRWAESPDPSLEAKVEIARQFSYDVEYDEEVKEKILAEI